MPMRAMPSVTFPLPPNMAMMNTFPGYDFDSPSPYPSSSPSSDSEGERYDFQSSNAALRSAITSISESKLRSIMIKLASSNPRFQRAITKELAYASMDSPPTTPTAPKPRKSRRSKTHRNCKGLSVSTKDLFAHKRNVTLSQSQNQEEFVYHPGHLDEEVYEFLSRTPEDVAFNVVRTITMWSCCDEDEWSPGCVVTPSSAISADRERRQDGIIEFSHPDVFPDSDLEQRCEDVLRDTIFRSSIEERSYFSP